ncbi:Type IV secretion-system, TraD, DNA-binding domain protein, partial [mine drainage metagenome]
GVTDVGQLYDLLVVSDREELKLLVGGTPAQPFFDEHNARMLDSIRSVTSSAVAALQHVAHQRAEPLSVRHWIRDGRGVLFIPVSRRTDRRAARQHLGLDAPGDLRDDERAGRLGRCGSSPMSSMRSGRSMD